jgi:hypothetical protein
MIAMATVVTTLVAPVVGSAAITGAIIARLAPALSARFAASPRSSVDAAAPWGRPHLDRSVGECHRRNP